ncbi:MAG: hypothetical protein Q7T11_09105, partial [Deltaproteobacteria bacterium]|nr:hypothetical protein [Deltaproteobacteria bacterium]
QQIQKYGYDFSSTPNGQVTRLILNGSKYEFGYDDSGLKTVNGTNIREILPVPASSAPLGEIDYHP